MKRLICILCFISLFFISNIFLTALDNPFFNDHQYSYQTLRAMGYAVSGAADINEILMIISNIREGDDESWYNEWYKTAERLEKSGDKLSSEGRTVSARQAYLKASNYYRTAEFFLHSNPDDERIISTWQKQKDCFLKYAELSGNIKSVEIPFEDTTLPGYLCISGDKKPLIIIQTGFDGTAEELYYAVGVFALERGYNLLLFEGPGQGEVIRKKGLPFRHDWETVIKPVVDFALGLDFVDEDRIVLMGISFGGYLAPRAVAFEDRIKVCIANGGIYDFSLTAGLSDEMWQALETEEGKAEINGYLLEKMKEDASLRWSVSNGMFTFKADSPAEWLRMLRDYTMKDSADRISCIMVIVDSEGDKDLPGQSKMLYDSIKSEKHLIHFSIEEGAGEHCQMGAILLSNARILDKLDEIMKQL